MGVFPASHVDERTVELQAVELAGSVPVGAADSDVGDSSAFAKVGNWDVQRGFFDTGFPNQ